MGIALTTYFFTDADIGSEIGLAPSRFAQLSFQQEPVGDQVPLHPILASGVARFCIVHPLVSHCRVALPSEKTSRRWRNRSIGHFRILA